MGTRSRKRSVNKDKLDDLIRRSKPYFVLEKQTRILELQMNRLVSINGLLGKGIMERDERIKALEAELEQYRAKEVRIQTAEEIEAERQARLAAPFEN